MGRAGQVLAEHIIEVGVQTSSRHFTRVLQFERTGSGITGIGKERFFLLFALFVKRFKPFPRQEHFSA